MTTAAELVVKVSADTASAEAELRGFSARALSGGGALASVFGGTLLAGGVMAAGRAISGLGRGVAGLGVDAIQSGAEFAGAMNGITAVLGGTAQDTENLSKLVMDLGVDPNLKVSATEAAGAIEMLATQGQTADQILGGTAKATVLLANATGGDMTQAAQVMSDSMVLFGVSTADAMDAVDGITGVSNVSKFTLNDYAGALAQAGGAAALSGVSMGDFNASIAGMASYFSSGSDAGTSFKTFLAQLNPITSKAKDAMMDLGLMTADGSNQFYDAQGNLKGMYDIVGLLNGATKDLTEQERKQALQTIFGNDAIRAAGALAGMTADEYENLYMQLNEGTSATENARIRTQGLDSAWATLGDTIDTAKMSFGKTLEAPLNVLVRAVTPAIGALQPMLTEWGKSIGDWISTKTIEVGVNVAPAFNVGGWQPALMAAIGTLTGGDVTIDTAARVVQVDWGDFGYTYDAHGKVTTVDWGDFTYEYNATTKISTVEWGDYTKTYNVETQVNHVEWGSYTATYDAVSKIQTVDWGGFHFEYDGTAGIRTVKWGDFTETYDAAAGIKTIQWGDWTFNYNVTATVISVAAGIFNWSYSVGAKIASVDWGETWTTLYTAIVAMWPDWGETWSTTYGTMANIFGDWGETWSQIYDATSKIFADWGDTWSRVYSAVVNLIPHWLGGGTEPGAPPAGNNAAGTTSWRGGLSWVGENGPELVALPRGSRVWNTRESMAMAGNNGVVINATVASPIDVEAIARRVRDLLRRG